MRAEPTMSLTAIDAKKSAVKCFGVRVQGLLHDINELFMISFNRFLKISVLLLAVLLSACAIQQPGQPKIVDHAFGFDARVDSKDTEILAFKYGIGGTPQTQAPYWKDENNHRQSTNTNGPIPLGETLYVKWRIKSTNEVFEDLVDLKTLLPADMHRQRIYFVVQGRQLFVYRIEPEPRPSDWPIVGPRKFQYEKTHQIYPILNR
jgi:hypothetical protein